MIKNHKSIWKNTLAIICWVIFIGCCIQTGVLFINYLYSFVKPSAAKDLYSGLDLSEVYNHNKTIFSFAAISLILFGALKAYIFYNVLKFFKLLNIKRPFTTSVLNLISKISTLTLITGFFILIVKNIILKLSIKNNQIDQVLNILEDGSTYIFMSVILMVITMLFKKGLALQTENDLTL